MMANTYSSLHYHIIFSTKNREPWLVSDIEQRIWAFIGGIARAHKMRALQVGGVEDHLHALVTAPTTIAPFQIAQYLKGDSSKWIHDEFPALRNFAWQDGYAAFTVSTSNIPEVITYIRNQREHHRKKTIHDLRFTIPRVDVIVFPDINPDGRHYSQNTFAMWRKNRNTASSGGQASKIGVDPNRNYDFLWDFNTTFDPAAQAGLTLASTDPSNDLFHGTAPFSEAETKSVRWLFEQYPHIDWFMDIHSYGGHILHAWGDDTNQASDPDKNFTNPAWDGKRGLPSDAYGEYIGACDLATAASAGNAVSAAIAGVRGETYAVAQAFFLPSWGSTYPTSGASDDWATSRYFANSAKKKVRAYCVEFNRVKTFFPSWADMEPIILDVDAGLIRFCLRAVPALSLPTWVCHLGRWWNA